jgi:hypothetical protein
MASNKKLKEGVPYGSKNIRRYEKTTSTHEDVAGGFGKKGTSDNQVKIWTSGERAIAFFHEQRSEPGKNPSDRYDSLYSQDTKTIDVSTFGPRRGRVTLADGQSVNFGDPLEPVTGTKKVQAFTVGPLVATALETKAASGSDEIINAFITTNIYPFVITTETVTVTTHVATLTNTPRQIELVEATAGTSTGNKGLVVDGPAAEGEVLVSYSAKTLTFSTTDAVTQAKVRYEF